MLSLINNISIITPVFNAASFIIKAVESALTQPETLEIILVEDGSTDDSLEVCKNLADKYDKVKLYTHPGNANKGAGSSRNLGIEKASGEFIAFLDADDFFLPDRFRAERKIFIEKPGTDGVYGALGFHYYSEKGKSKFQEQGFGKLTTVSGHVPPNELFLVLVALHEKISGYFSIVTLTIKKSALHDNRILFENIRLHQDTVFLMKLSLTCNLETGIINEPVGLRGVHDNNRVVENNPKSNKRLLMWSTLYTWSANEYNNKFVTNLFEAFVVKEKITYSDKFYALYLLIRYSLTNHFFIMKGSFFNPSCTHVFGKRIAGWIIYARDTMHYKFFNNLDFVKNHCRYLMNSKLNTDNYNSIKI